MTLRNFVPYRVTTYGARPAGPTSRGPRATAIEHGSNSVNFRTTAHHDHGGHQSARRLVESGIFPGRWLSDDLECPAIHPPSARSIRAAAGWLPNPEPVGTAPQAVQPPGPAAANAPAKGTPKARIPSSKARAGKFIGFGDANFANQKYLAAIERYKSASRIAPDLAEPYLRQGHALVALGQYENAVKAFRRGLRIRGRVERISVSAGSALRSRSDRQGQPHRDIGQSRRSQSAGCQSADRLGMQLFFDGQAERAGVFFARVAQLGGNDDVC